MPVTEACAHNIHMSDIDQSPSGPKAAQTSPSAPRGKARRRAQAPKPLSRESRFVGYLVLGFGFLAVVSVLFIAFSRGGGEDSGGPVAPVAVTPENRGAAQGGAALDVSPRELIGALPQAGPKAPEVEVVDTDLFFERVKNFNAGAMEGDWQALIGRYTAVLQIRKSVYQIILASADPASPRYYSSGTYELIEDILVLNPRQDWPPPGSSASVSYSRLTRAPFPVIARYQGDGMLWQNPPQSEKRVSGPYTSPLFMSENIKVAHWKKIK